MKKTIEDEISEIEKSLSNDTDIGIGIKELFKDGFKDNDKDNLDCHDVDIRTRLNHDEIRSMSITNFLSTIKVSGLRPSIDIRKNRISRENRKNDDVSIALGLDILMFNIKRHKISERGASRKEITDILQNTLEFKRRSGLFGGFFGKKGEPV